MTEEMDLITTIIMVFISPLGLYMAKGKLDGEFLLNLVLYILTFTVLGTMHAFYTFGMDIIKIILNYFIPPLPVYLVTRDLKKTIICCLLCFLLWIPGVVYAYWVTVNEKKDEALIKD